MSEQAEFISSSEMDSLFFRLCPVCSSEMYQEDDYYVYCPMCGWDIEEPDVYGYPDIESLVGISAHKATTFSQGVLQMKTLYDLALDMIEAKKNCIAAGEALREARRLQEEAEDTFERWLHYELDESPDHPLLVDDGDQKWLIEISLDEGTVTRCCLLEELPQTPITKVFTPEPSAGEDE